MSPLGWFTDARTPGDTEIMIQIVVVVVVQWRTTGALDIRSAFG